MSTDRIVTGSFSGNLSCRRWREMPASGAARYSLGRAIFLVAKFIFPTDKLSIQVIPDDAYAAAHEKPPVPRQNRNVAHRLGKA